MRIVTEFSTAERDPYRDIALRSVRSSRPDRHQVLQAPADWPLSVSEALAGLKAGSAVASRPLPAAQRPFPDFLAAAADVPDHQPSVFGALDRLTIRWARWGWSLGLFDDAGDARCFLDDIRWLLARRALAPDTVAWLGAAAMPALRGFGVDPATGIVTPAHVLPGFAPVAPGVSSDAGADTVVRLIREAVGQRGDRPAEPRPPTVTLDPMRFLLADGSLDPAALARAARLAAVVAEIEVSTRVSASEAQARAAFSQRPIAIGIANLGAFVTSQGLAYDSEAGRALAVAATALVTAAVAAASAEIARTAGPCAAFTAARKPVRAQLNRGRDSTEQAVLRLAAIAQPAHLEDTAAGIAAVLDPLWEAALAAPALRHTRFTAIGTSRQHRPLPLDIQSAGSGPLASHTADVELANGQFARVVQPAVLAGLGMLGHGVTVQAAAVRRLRGHRSLAGAPGISLEDLRSRGFDQESLDRLEVALGEAAHLRQVLTTWVLGPVACDRVLGLDPAVTVDYGFDLPAALGFAPEAVAAANRHCVGGDTLAGLAGLADADAAVLAPPADPDAAEAAMLAALDAVVSAPAQPPATDAMSETPAAEVVAATAGLTLAATARS